MPLIPGRRRSSTATCGGSGTLSASASSALASFADYFHVRLRREDREQPLPHYRVIVDDEDAYRLHGSVRLRLVAEIDCHLHLRSSFTRLESSNRAPISAARSRIPARPKCPGGGGQAVSKPSPSSLTRMLKVA